MYLEQNKSTSTAPASLGTGKIKKQHDNYNYYNSNYKNIPEELTKIESWVRYNLIDQGRKKPSKIPYHYYEICWAKVNDKTTWGNFNTVISTMNKKYNLPVWMRINPAKKCWDFQNSKYIKYETKSFDGIGYVFSHNCPYIGIDYDNWFDENRNINAKSKEILSKCNNSYTELSRSGTGGHTILKLKSLDDKEKLSRELIKRYGKPTGVRNDSIGLECYFTGRYFVMTGNVIDKYTQIREVEIDTILELFEGIKKEVKNTNNTNSNYSLNLDNSKIIEIASKAKNSSDFINLLNGGNAAYNGDESRGDMAFLGYLACYTQDVEQLKNIILSSARYREKLERSDYLIDTINLAIQNRAFTYDTNYNNNTSNPSVTLKSHEESKTKNKKIIRVFNIFIDKTKEDIKLLEYKLNQQLEKNKGNSADTEELTNEIEKLNKLLTILINDLYSGKAEKDYNKILEIKDIEEKTKFFKTLTLVFHKIYTINNGINPYFIAEIISLYFPMFYWGNSLFIYNKGVYEYSEITVFEKIIMFILRYNSKISRKNEILDNIKNINHIDITKFNEYIDNRPYVMNFKNGLVVFDKDFLNTGNTHYKLKPHTPEYKSILQMNFDFNDNLTIDEILEKTPNFQKFLNTSLNTEEERQFAIEKLAYTYFNNRVDQEITFVCGEGGNGKGVYQNILTKLHRTPIKQPNITELTDPDKRNNFFTYKLLFASAIFTTEARDIIKDTSLIKSITGYNKIDIELKYLKHQIQTMIHSKLFISTNHDIRFLAWTKGDERRANFLEMNNEIKEDPEIERNIIKEMKYINMYIVYKGLFPLIERKFKSFTLPKSHFKLFKKYQEYNNNVLSFINNHITIDINGKILKSDIFYLMNKEFVNQYKIKKKLFDKFEKELKKQKINVDIVKTSGYSFEIEDKKSGAIFYKGIKYEEFKETEKQYLNTEVEGKELESRYFTYEKMTDIELQNEITLIKNILANRQIK